MQLLNVTAVQLCQSTHFVQAAFGRQAQDEHPSAESQSEQHKDKDQGSPFNAFNFGGLMFMSEWMITSQFNFLMTDYFSDLFQLLIPISTFTIFRRSWSIR